MNQPHKNTAPTLIDLFCGAGGLSEGFKQAGFKVLAGNDIDSSSGVTFAKTHPGTVFIPGSIRELSAEDFLGINSLRKGDLDCLVGGPPCQGYSVYNHKRGMHDSRSHLFTEFLRIVEGLFPKWVVIENVTGITSTGNGDVVSQIKLGLKQLGYFASEHKVLRSEDYGVPQERRRVIIIANRIGVNYHWPSPTHGKGLKPFNTVRDAIGDLPKLNNGEAYGLGPYTLPFDTEYQKEMRKNSSLVANHAAPKLGEINLNRMKHIPQGGSWRNIPFDLLPNGMKSAKRSDHTKRYGRLTWEGLASTILTKCDVHWGAYIHPETDRSLTVREAARFQSFPDNYIFQGSRTEQFVQVGNAVPPLLARAIAMGILKSPTKPACEIDTRKPVFA